MKERTRNTEWTNETKQEKDKYRIKEWEKEHELRNKWKIVLIYDPFWMDIFQGENGSWIQSICVFT